MERNRRAIPAIVVLVKKDFEAWDPSLGMVTIMNTGTTLKTIGIVFNRRLEPQHPTVRIAGEFESQGHRYYGEFDRIRENTETCNSTSEAKPRE
jgi:hypothetical protein